MKLRFGRNTAHFTHQTPAIRNYFPHIALAAPTQTFPTHEPSTSANHCPLPNAERTAARFISAVPKLYLFELTGP
jgi:hypothetical protein